MGAWKYCEACGFGLPDPSKWSTKALVIGALKDQNQCNAVCTKCYAHYYEEPHLLIEELAERIDRQLEG